MPEQLASYMRKRAILLKSLGLCRDCGKRYAKRTSVLCSVCTQARSERARRKKHAVEL